MACSNFGKIENKTFELLLRRLVALEESNGFNKKLLYALFVSFLALVLYYWSCLIILFVVCDNGLMEVPFE